jgi:hypothetical protein
MTLLSFQAFQDQNPRFNGQLTSLNRYQASLTIHNFFLAATILCTALLLLKDKSKVKFPLCASLKPSKGDMFIALEKSIAIFDQDGAETLEAHRASKLLSAILGEIRHLLLAEHEEILFQPGAAPLGSLQTDQGSSADTANSSQMDRHDSRTCQITNSRSDVINSMPQMEVSSPLTRPEVFQLLIQITIDQERCSHFWSRSWKSSLFRD